MSAGHCASADNCGLDKMFSTGSLTQNFEYCSFHGRNNVEFKSEEVSLAKQGIKATFSLETMSVQGIIWIYLNWFTTLA